MEITTEMTGKTGATRRSTNRQKMSGFTLIELMIVMIIVAIGVALAAPSFENIIQKRQTTAEAEQLAAFLSIVRSEAIKLNEEVRVNFDYTSADDWCLSAVTGAAVCDCDLTEDPDITDDPRDDTFCDIGGAPGITGARQTMDNSEFNKSELPVGAPNVDKSFSFDPVRGSMTVADLVGGARTFVIESTNAKYQLTVEISVVGRTRICNADSTKKVPGYSDCA